MFFPPDRQILRDLAKRVADIAALPIQEERRALWRRHNSLQRVRPMSLIFPEGSWRELLPDTVLQCQDKDARRMEWDLRHRIYTHEHFDADNVIEKEWIIYKAVRNSGWGLKAEWTHSASATGARKFKPVIQTPADLKKLCHPTIEHDEAETGNRIANAQELFGDILDVKLRGVSHISFHLMSQYTAWRGLEEVMLDMLEEPEWLRDALEFLTEGNERLVRQYVERNLLCLNNDNTYHSSGGNGYTNELPAKGFDPQRVRLCDMWGSAEAQELAQVSPEMHEEFSLKYEKRLMAPFGLNGYGCCEDLSKKLDYVFKIPNIRRISISPFADVERSAEQLKGNYIFSWKPHPAHLVGDYAPQRIREYIQHTVRVARDHGCVLEMILKDTHTCESRPERFDEWAKIARQVGAEN